MNRNVYDFVEKFDNDGSLCYLDVDDKVNDDFFRLSTYLLLLILSLVIILLILILLYFSLTSHISIITVGIILLNYSSVGNNAWYYYANLTSLIFFNRLFIIWQFNL